MIYEQLAEQCDCIKKVDNKDIDELISLVSMATCWQQHPCETFLVSERQEVIDIDDCLCDCEIVKFSPFYTPFDPESFTFTLVRSEGIEEELIPVSEFNYSTVEGVFKIKPPLPDCTCMSLNCNCKPKYKLLVQYTAGFNDLPDCLLPIFCEGLQYIIERRECDCAACQECQKYDEDKVEVLIPNAATITNQLKVYWIRVLSEQYKRQLAMISLCKEKKRLWGIVV